MPALQSFYVVIFVFVYSSTQGEPVFSIQVDGVFFFDRRSHNSRCGISHFTCVAAKSNLRLYGEAGVGLGSEGRWGRLGEELDGVESGLLPVAEFVGASDVGTSGLETPKRSASSG